MRHKPRELVKRSKNLQAALSRAENVLIGLRLDHLKPFANVLGFSPEQILRCKQSIMSLPLPRVRDQVHFCALQDPAL
jgi:hypothetical protein